MMVVIIEGFTLWTFKIFNLIQNFVPIRDTVSPYSWGAFWKDEFPNRELVAAG